MVDNSSIETTMNLSVQIPLAVAYFCSYPKIELISVMILYKEKFQTFILKSIYLRNIFLTPYKVEVSEIND